MYWPTLVILVLSSVAANVLGASIPDYIQVCRRSDPKVEECILKSIESLRERLKTGLPELDVPAIEPLILPLVKVTDEPSRLTAYGRDIKVYGVGDFQITNLKLETVTDNRLTVHIGLNIPRLQFEGDYEVNASVSSYQINGNGRIKASAVNVKADMTVYGQIRKKGNHNYLRFTKMDMGLKIDDYNIRLENLFSNKELNEAINGIINENRREIMKSINPIITKNAIENILDIANKMAKNQPFDLLFPA